MGGMAAQIPIKSDPDANEAAMAKVRADKLREVRAGHDGTWVAHPGLVPIAKEIFDANMPGPNQIDRKREEVRIGRDDLLKLPEGPITEKGMRQNINVGILYLEAWFAGLGCVPLYNLMEDAATAEISRTQLWQWIHHGAKLDDGRTIDAALYERLRGKEVASMPAGDSLNRAVRLFDALILDETLADFLTIPAYDQLIEIENGGPS
jgi:malate synthase